MIGTTILFILFGHQIVSELRTSEPRIILLANSRDLDNHNAARRRNGQVALSYLDGRTYRMNQTTFVESRFEINIIYDCVHT